MSTSKRKFGRPNKTTAESSMVVGYVLRLHYLLGLNTLYMQIKVGKSVLPFTAKRKHRF